MKANLIPPQILPPQQHPQVVFAFHGLPGQSSEKHRHKTWQPRVERALLCSTALNSLVIPLSSPGLARLYSPAKNETNAKHKVSRTRPCSLRWGKRQQQQIPFSPLRAAPAAARMLQAHKSAPKEKFGIVERNKTPRAGRSLQGSWKSSS